MIARVAGLFTLCMLTTGAAMAPAALEVTPARTACREAIAQLETVTRTESTVPDWELAEAWGWHATARPRSTLARFHIPFITGMAGDSLDRDKERPATGKRLVSFVYCSAMVAGRPNGLSTRASARSTARTSARHGRRRTLRALARSAASATRRCSAGSVRSAMALAAMPSRSARSWRNPVTPCAMTSGRPPTFDATTGTSQAMASSAARPKLSCADGNRKTSATESSGITSSCAPSISTSGAMFELPAEPVGRPELGPVADEQQPRRHRAADPGEDLHHRIDPLDGPEVRHVDHELRRRRPARSAVAGPGTARRR